MSEELELTAAQEAAWEELCGDWQQHLADTHEEYRQELPMDYNL